MSSLTELPESPVTATVAPERPRAPRRFAMPGFAARLTPGVVIAIVLLVVAVLWALVPGLFAHQSPIDGVPADRLQGPSGAHWFGTDHLGRDVFSRVVHGSSLTLRATVIAVLLGLVIGSLVGLVAGFASSWADSVLMRIVDVLLAVPALLLSLTVVVALGFGTVNIAIAVGVGAIASFARLMRAEVLRVKTSDFVEASMGLGRSWLGTLREHVLPNAWGPVLALATLEFGTAILAVSSLSFLGFGAQPPAPEWGQLVSEGRNYLATAWWLTAFPGAVVAAVVMSANRLGRALESDGGRR